MKFEMKNYEITLSANNKYIPGLDGLRALSILIVWVAHLGFEKIVPGGLGVTVFFFISGFLITRLLASEQNENEGNIDLKNFYIRRFLRLMPALFVYVIVLSIIAALFNAAPLIVHFLSAMFYFVNYYDALAPMLNWPERIIPWGQLWSLAVEEHFYLIFPALLVFLGRTHKQRLILIVSLIILSALWRFIAFFVFNLGDDYTYQATDTRFESIAWGCLLAVIMDGSKKVSKYIVNLPVFIIAIAMILFTLLYRNDDFRATLRYTIQGIALFLIIYNLYFNKYLNFAINILETKFLRHFGRLSYSIYLWHWPIIWYLRDYGHAESMSMQNMLISIIIGYACAIISYKLVEMPMFKLRKKFGAHPVEDMSKA